MSDDEEWGGSAADPDADWGDADADAESGWGDDDVKDGADTSGWDDTQPSASSSLPIPDADELPSLSRQASYRILDNDSLAATQNKLIAQNAEVLFVTPAEAGLLLRHYGWKSKKLQSEWFETQRRRCRRVGCSVRVRTVTKWIWRMRTHSTAATGSVATVGAHISSVRSTTGSGPSSPSAWA